MEIMAVWFAALMISVSVSAVADPSGKTAADLLIGAVIGLVCGAAIVGIDVARLRLSERRYARRRAKEVAEEAAKREPMERMIRDLVKTYESLIDGGGPMPTRLVVPISEMPSLYTPRSSVSDRSIKDFLADMFMVEVVAERTDSMHFDGARA